MKNGKMKNGITQQDVFGTKHWHLNNKLHRTDGPAMEFPDGHKEWWLNDEYYGSGNIPPTEYTLATLAYEGMSE